MASRLAQNPPVFSVLFVSSVVESLSPRVWDISPQRSQRTQSNAAPGRWGSVPQF